MTPSPFIRRPSIWLRPVPEWMAETARVILCAALGASLVAAAVSLHILTH